MELTLDQLKRTMPRCRHPEYLPLLNAAMAARQIDTPLRVAAFLAQIAHESYEFRFMSEVWGPTPQQLRYERPVVSGKLEDPAPAGQRQHLWQQLGNTEPGDGYRYRGMGPIQLTGRENFRLYGQAMGLDLEGHPELAQDPAVGFKIAAEYWAQHGLNRYADRGDFDAVTRGINGGLNGKQQRDAYYAAAKAALGIA